MKAQVLYKTAQVEEKPLQFIDVPLPKIEKSEILIKVLACGMCLTDRHIIEGDLSLKHSPIIPGHQIVGKVEKIGESVTNFKIGEMVGVPWLFSTCSQCYYCTHGNENLCEHSEFTGRDVNGGYAQYTKAKEDFAIKLTKEINPIQFAPLLCAGIVGYRSYKLSMIKPGEHLGLFGFGSAAHIVIQIANYQGCDISVFTRGKPHQEHAKKLGAIFAGPVDKAPPKPLDSAIIFAPAGELVPFALNYLKRGGTLAFNAIHASPIPQLDYSQIYYEKKLLSVANATREDAVEFLQIAVEANVHAQVTTYPIEEANQAHIDAKNGKVTGSIVFVL